MPTPPPEAYREALVNARGIAAEITEDRTRRFQEAVSDFARGIERALSGADLQGLSSDAALEASERIVRAQAEQLRQNLLTATAEGRTASYEQVLNTWRQTAREVYQAAGTDLAALGGIRAADVSLLNAFDAIGAAQNWRTLLRGHVENAAREANEIVRRGLTEGVTGDELARRMRRYVEGSEDFQDLFTDVPTVTGDVAKIDIRGVPGGAQGAAKEMAFNARRIGFSEIQNARAEAELQHFLQDPLVESVRWTLSPNRGVSFSPPDECDVLARRDLYGMGAGVYPIDSCPPPPHPFDRCEKRPVTRDLEKAQDPKPLGRNPARGGSDVDIPRSEGLTEARMERIRENVDRSLRQGQEALRGLVERTAA